MPRASRVEEEIREGFPSANIKLLESSGGDFRVFVNSKIIYDKALRGDFPKIFEITKLIKDLV